MVTTRNWRLQRPTGAGAGVSRRSTVPASARRSSSRHAAAPPLQRWCRGRYQRLSLRVCAIAGSSPGHWLLSLSRIPSCRGCQEMRLLGLASVLILILTGSDADLDPDCEDCHQNGGWFPLFQPSQIISSELPEHAQYRSHEAPPPLTYATARPQLHGVDGPVRSYEAGGEHRLEWDHYGDVTTVASVYNSLEGGAPVEDRSDVSTSGSPEQDASGSGSREAFFENASFFDEKQSEKSEEFDVSQMYSGEHIHHNSIEDFSQERFGRRPIATSYATISSVFESRPVPRARDLLHPVLGRSRVPHYVDPPRRANRTRYHVHEPLSREDPGVLRITHPRKPSDTAPLAHRPSSYVPLDHPVYRYVKVHGALPKSTLHLDDIHPQLRSKFPFKYLRPRVRVQNHETYVRHVMPTKDPFSDSFFKESQKIEDLKPPPMGQTLYYFKKKPSAVEMKSIARRSQSPGFMYIIRRKKN